MIIKVLMHKKQKFVIISLILGFLMSIEYLFLGGTSIHEEKQYAVIYNRFAESRPQALQEPILYHDSSLEVSGGDLMNCLDESGISFW